MKPKISTAHTCEIGGKSDRCGKPANDFFKLQSHDGVVLIDSWFCPKHFAEVLDEHKDWGPIQRKGQITLIREPPKGKDRKGAEVYLAQLLVNQIRHKHAHPDEKEKWEKEIVSNLTTLLKYNSVHIAYNPEDFGGPKNSVRGTA
jgi:hypothetical protein